MKTSTIALMIFLIPLKAMTNLVVVDKKKLATVTLHTELIESSKRVYLAADFEANHTQGLVACKLGLEHRNGKLNGPVYQLDEHTSLLPNEKLSFNMGLFPSKFHASGLDVKANLECHKITFFDDLTKKLTAKKSEGLKKDKDPNEFCCRFSPLAINCAHSHEDGHIDINRTTQLQSTAVSNTDYPPCYLEE